MHASEIILKNRQIHFDAGMTKTLGGLLIWTTLVYIMQFESTFNSIYKFSRDSVSYRPNATNWLQLLGNSPPDPTPSLCSLDPTLLFARHHIATPSEFRYDS